MKRHNPGLKDSGITSILTIFLVVMAAAVLAFVGFTLFKKSDISTSPSQNTPIKEAESSPLMAIAPSSPATPTPSAAVPSSNTSSPGLSTFKNDQYDFQLDYPKSYKALSSKDDLSAYPNGVLLLYSGGQAYDVIVEVWDAKAKYESEYGFSPSDLTVIESGDKFITLLDNTKTPESKKIIESFKQLP